MLFIYNLIQVLLAPLMILVLPVYLISRPEKSKSILPKLGYKLKPINEQTRSTVWVHALSVGEVTSVLPLVQRMKKDIGESTTIVFTTSTLSGYQLAARLLTPYCDRLMFAPLDILPVVHHFIKTVSPDLFILVETDFWPNLLHSLKRSNIPALLVNGRVSDSSIQKYLRFRAFFFSMMNQFDALCMQTAADRDKMIALGIDDRKIKVLGNLKFSGPHNQPSPDPETSPFPENKLVLLAGSTHKGEERVLLDVFKSVREITSDIHLVLAPRNLNRAGDIVSLADSSNLTTHRFSKSVETAADVTIIDTIGDLSGLYRFADICFIGGSLVDEGGHNPIEAARSGKVVVFGPHMDDFSEISDGLIEAGGAIQVFSPEELRETVSALASSEKERTVRGENGFSFISRHQHIVADHMQIIRPYL